VDSFVDAGLLACSDHLLAKFLNQFGVVATYSSTQGFIGVDCVLMEQCIHVEI